MTPYYEQDGITIFHADCREVLPMLAAGSVDLTFTDPPYNVGLDYSGGDARPDYWEWTVEWVRACPQPLVVTPGIVNLWMWMRMDKPRWVFSWVKPNQCSPSALGGFNTWEPVLVYGSLPRRVPQDSLIRSIQTNQRHLGDHPCPKDMRSWQTLLAMFAPAVGTILDPFLGTGTTLVAAKNLGLKAIGIEIEERYCEIAAKRLQQSVLPLEVSA